MPKGKFENIWREITPEEVPFVTRHWEYTPAELAQTTFSPTRGLLVTCYPGVTGFAAVLPQPDGFIWAVFAGNGECRERGVERSLGIAQHEALVTLALWGHRCVACESPSCSGICQAFSGL